MKRNILLCLSLAAVWNFACQSGHNTTQEQKSDTVTLDSTAFTSDINGKTVTLYTLKNEQGMTVYLTNFGARIVGLHVPNKEGIPTDVVLGFTKASAYHNPEEPYFGTIVGPFGNRIAKGTFSLGENTYKLPQNNGVNTLHG